MISPDLSNTNFRLAADLVHHTSQHIFLTGKAGSGKTTFLKYITGSATKNTVVVAPTGVAAINAGGVTMHSFFQLPFEPFLPQSRNQLLSKIHFSEAKIDLIQELELLIIDEVSMVRCDQLDAIDTILRTLRKKYYVPFGGVQVLLIGDLYQLPPVIPDAEWDMLSHIYASPFFFESHVLHNTSFLYVELKKIYRQKEQAFIDLLNNIRNNSVTEHDFELLHTRYQPDFIPEENEKYIVITTHNYKADIINNDKLRKLPGKPFVFSGKVEGDFAEKVFPTELELHLKIGAQVMFVKNDSGEERRYFNGKLATVRNIFKDEITVVMDDGTECILEKETWRNVKYSVNKENGFIDEEEVGSFTQFPVRLAWAITVHKSQGLTFEKAVIDAGNSFAAGQVYVALSRCTTLEGMVLLSKIHPSVIGTNERILAFAKNETEEDILQQTLEKEKTKYLAARLDKAFDWSKFVSMLEEFVSYVPSKKLPEPEEAILVSRSIYQAAKQQKEVADKFRDKLPVLIADYEINHSPEMEEKVQKAILWFGKSIGEEILAPLQKHISSLTHASKVKLYKKYLMEMHAACEIHLKKLFSITYGDIHFIKEENAYLTYLRASTPEKHQEGNKKQEKGATFRESLQLFRQGISIPDIARMRNLTEGTIHTHLTKFISTGEVTIHELVEKEKISIILREIESSDVSGLSALREKLGEDFSFPELRAVAAYYESLQKI